MAKYLLAIHRPDNYDPSLSEDEAISRDIDWLNDEMTAWRQSFCRWSASGGQRKVFAGAT